MQPSLYKIQIGYHMASRAIRDLSPRHPRETEINGPRRSRGLLSRFPEGGGSDNPRIARESRVIIHLYPGTLDIKVRRLASSL